MLLALGALAVLGALEIAAIYGTMGFIIEFVFGINLPIMAMRYRQAEARRLDAEALRRS